MGIEVKKFLSSFINENTYVIKDRDSMSAAVIDPGVYNQAVADSLQDYVLKYIILTHAHGDHIKDIKQYIKLYPDARIVIDENEADRLANPELNGSAEMFDAPISVTADIRCTDDTTLTLGDNEISFIRTPGHTPGGQCILVDNKLFSGDTLFFMSVGATHFPGGSWDELKDSIHNKLWTLPDDIQVYPGHGQQTSIGYEKRANPFV